MVGPAEPIGGWIAVGGAALALLGSFMPWATVRSVFGTINVSGTEGDGVITLALAALAAGFAIPLILRRSPPQQAFPIIVIVAAAICAVVGIADAANVSRVAEEETTNYVDVSVGFGLYIVIAGGIAAVVGGAIAFHKQRAFAQARPAQGVRSGGEVPKAELDEWRAANARSSVSWEDWRNARSSEV